VTQLGREVARSTGSFVVVDDRVWSCSLHFTLLQAPHRSRPGVLTCTREQLVNVSEHRPIQPVMFVVGGGKGKPPIWAQGRGPIVMFFSLAVELDPRVGHTMDVLSPFISVLCHSD